MQLPDVAGVLERFPQHHELKYGTAGFRAHHSVLPRLVYLVGVLAAHRSAFLNNKAIGVMITASHNPVDDNGVKIVDPDGGMLEQSWEEIASRIVMANSPEALLAAFQAIPKRDASSACPAAAPTVIVAMDTRPHSPLLSQLVVDGVLACGAVVHNLGVRTTPQLHWHVGMFNRHASLAADELYFSQMAAAFQSLVGVGAQLGPLIIDCANGVGATIVEPLLAQMKSHGVAVSGVEAVNTRLDAQGLNDGVGAEHVQKKQLPPSGISKSAACACASVDGDADRLVYFYFEANGSMVLLDGDKIATLFAVFLADCLKDTRGIKVCGAAATQEHNTNPLAACAQVSVVQTAYANGASSKFLLSRGVVLHCVPTGVKHLHHKALEADVGVYFEANGHGSVLVKDAAMLQIQQAADGGSAGATRAVAFLSIINKYAGDAFADMLAVEAVLQCSRISMREWNAYYSDFPSRQSKVVVPDRYARALLPPLLLPPRSHACSQNCLGRVQAAAAHRAAARNRHCGTMRECFACCAFDVPRDGAPAACWRPRVCAAFRN
jgi:phosphoacetylglucosamine mutase